MTSVTIRIKDGEISLVDGSPYVGSRHTLLVEEVGTSYGEELTIRFYGNTPVSNQVLAETNPNGVLYLDTDVVREAIETSRDVNRFSMAVFAYSQESVVASGSIPVQWSPTQTIFEGRPIDVVGPQGEPGKSAYEYAQEGGYAGSEYQFAQDLGKTSETIQKAKDAYDKAQKSELDVATMKESLEGKQDKLTAGATVVITEENVIDVNASQSVKTGDMLPVTSDAVSKVARSFDESFEAGGGEVDGSRAVAIGYGASANSYSTSVGSNAKSKGGGSSVAIGTSATCNGSSSVAVGNSASSVGNSVAIGSGANAAGIFSIFLNAFPNGLSPAKTKDGEILLRTLYASILAKKGNYVLDDMQAAIEGKQDKLTAGRYLTIDGNLISVDDQIADDIEAAVNAAANSAAEAKAAATTAGQSATVATNAAAAADEAKTAAAGSALSASESATDAASSATSAGQSASAAEAAKVASEDAAKRAEEAAANLGPATTETLGLVKVGENLKVDADGTLSADASGKLFGPLEGYKVTENVLGIEWSVYFAAFVQGGKLIAVYGQNRYDVYVVDGESAAKVITIGAASNMKCAWQDSDDSVKIGYLDSNGVYQLATITDGAVTATVTMPSAVASSARALIPFGRYLVSVEGKIYAPSDLSEVGTFTAPVFKRLIFSEDGESIVFAAVGDLSRITRMTLSAEGVPSFTYSSRLGDKTLRAFAMPDGSCLLCKAFSDSNKGAILATNATRDNDITTYDATGGCLVSFKDSVHLPYGMILCADGIKTARAVRGTENPSQSFVEVVDVYRRNFGYFGNPYLQAVGAYAFASPLNSKGDFAVFASLYYANSSGARNNRYWIFSKEA